MSERDPSDIFIKAFTGLQSSWNINHLEDLPGIKPNADGKKETVIRVQSNPVTPDLYISHLQGKFGIGISPINGSNECFYAVVDVDVYDESSRMYLLNLVQVYDLPFLVFRSKSGGIHMYMFFSAPEKAKSVREALKLFVNIFALDIRFCTPGGVSKVEIFPKQDTLSAAGRGSFVTLPYFNYQNPINPMLAPDGSAVPFARAMLNIDSSFTTLKAFHQVLDELPYKDAPVCIQRALFSGALIEDSGRDDFFVTVAVYFKKKLGKDIVPAMKEFNSLIPAPVSDADIERISASIVNSTCQYKCKGSVCSRFCNAKECSKREFGVGRNKGHFTGLEYGQLTRMEARDPYYIWELRVNGNEKWTPIIFRDEVELADQKCLLKYCMRYLNMAPYQVNQNDYLEIINTIMLTVKNVKVNASTDTTDTSQIYKFFIRFLVNHSMAASGIGVGNAPYKIHTGEVYVDEQNNYCFAADGLIAYITAQHVNTKNILWSDLLTKFGCTEGFVSYETKGARKVTIPCWKHAVDEAITGEASILTDIIEGDKDAIARAVANSSEGFVPNTAGGSADDDRGLSGADDSENDEEEDEDDGSGSTGF